MGTVVSQAIGGSLLSQAIDGTLLSKGVNIFTYGLNYAKNSFSIQPCVRLQHCEKLTIITN